MPDAELTLIANVALDRVNGGPWTGGGCPAFARFAFHFLGAGGVIDTSCADGDRAHFEALSGDGLLTVRFLSAATTTRFDLDYEGRFGERRSMVVHAIGHAWSPADIDGLGIATEWVHLAPLMRSDFPAATVARLAAAGHRIAYDGQGLVRAPQRGDMRLDADYDRGLLAHLTALKLSDDEAAVLAAGGADEALRADLAAVPELILTHGARGAEVRTAGVTQCVTPERVISEVQSTGAGDAFMVGYGVGRQRGLTPCDAADLGARVACALLAERKERGVL